jgi:predicted transcriptional regulator
MSPRAAWRLERLGYHPVYHYLTGKADWLAAGLPTEGAADRSARVDGVMHRSVPTCTPEEVVADVVRRVKSDGAQVCIVVTESRVVLGRLRVDLADALDTRTAEEAMDPGPVTVRADVGVVETLDRMRARRVRSLIVTNPDGVLLGLVTSE